MRLKKCLLTGLVVPLAVVATLCGPSVASAQNVSQPETPFSFSEASGGRDVVITLEDLSRFETSEGDAVVKDAHGNLTEVMPTGATDSQGEHIGFYDQKIADNRLLVAKTDPNGFVTYEWSSDWGKCVVGAARSATEGDDAGGEWGPIGRGIVGAAGFC